MTECCPDNLDPYDIKLAVQYITADLMRDNKCSESDINNGLCDIFANRLVQRLNLSPKCRVNIVYKEKEIGIPRPYYHMVTKVCDKYYDSEKPYGVSDYKELPIIKEWIDDGLEEKEVFSGSSILDDMRL